MEHRHPANSGIARRTGRLMITIVLNVVITAAEFIGGLVTGYLALIADAVHNLSDVAALILAYIGEVSTRRAPTKKSTYGYKRIEVMTAFVSAVALVVIAIIIFYEAYQRFITPVVLKNPAVILIVAGIGLVGNVFSVILLHGSRKETLNIKAAFLHMLFDTISSLAVIIGAILIIYTGWYFIDPLLASLIGLLILWSSFDVLKEATIIFMEGVPRQIEYDRVAEAIKGHPSVLDVHDLHIWALSSTDIALSCHICLDKDDYLQGPAIIRELSETLNRNFDIGHATIQPEQADCPSADIGWFNHDEEKQS